MSTEQAHDKVPEPTFQQDPDRMELVDVESQEETTEQTQEDSPVFSEAREGGWVPLDEWKGKPDEWVDAKEFLFRGELMGRIKQQSKFINSLKGDMDEMRDAFKELGEHNKKIAVEERKRVLKELREAKKEAFEDRDFDTLEEIDERMDELKSVDLDDVEEKPAPKEESNEVDPVVQKWLDSNTWYSQDPILYGATNAIVQSLLNDDPTLEQDPETLLGKAKKLVQKELPHKFKTDDDEEEEESPRSHVTETSGEGQPKPSKKSKYRASHLNEEQKKIGQVFVRTGAFKTLDEYATDLAKLGELDVQKGA